MTAKVKRSRRLSRHVSKRAKDRSPVTIPPRRTPRTRTAPPKRRLHAFAIPPYKYTALNRDASEIRLMTLLPGFFGSEVRITIKNVVFSKSRLPTYEALSYAWGSSDKSVNIRVKESEEVRTLAVTSNLEEALQYLRYEENPRILWIDAICVDQDNFAERGHQVSRMADIYRSASPVIVWLGRESTSSAKAMTELSALGSTVRFDWATSEVTLLSGDSKITQLSGEEYQAWKAKPWLLDKKNSVRRSVESLLDRLWFKRLWIWQEVRLAKKGVRILCGDKTMQWETFRNAIWCIGLKPSPWGSKLLILASRVLDICNYSGPLSSLENILRRTRSCQYSDPRDRIYAILNLTYSFDVSGLEADYPKSTEEVFRSVVSNYLSSRDTLGILSQCEMRTSKAIKVPSWVPDWTVPNECETLLGSKSCWASRAQALFNNEGVLQVIACCVATVDAIPNVWRLAHVESQVLLEYVFVDTVRRLISELQWRKWKGNTPTDDVSIMEALCRTLCCNRFAESYLPPKQGSPRFQESQDYVLRIMKSNALPTYRPFYESVFYSTMGRAFFATAEGHIGLAPHRLRPGDQVCIILGCQSPLVLRANKDGDYIVIGECYVHGLADGAGLLGMLPSNWQRVDRYDPHLKFYYDAFINHDTGAIQVEDPRLGPLPPGWTISDHKYRHVYNVYSNMALGTFKTQMDPRMNPEALKARGITLQEFRLV